MSGVESWLAFVGNEEVIPHETRAIDRARSALHLALYLFIRLPSGATSAKFFTAWLPIFTHRNTHKATQCRGVRRIKSDAGKKGAGSRYSGRIAIQQILCPYTQMQSAKQSAPMTCVEGELRVHGCPRADGNRRIRGVVGFRAEVIHKGVERPRSLLPGDPETSSKFRQIENGAEDGRLGRLQGEPLTNMQPTCIQLY